MRSSLSNLGGAIALNGNDFGMGKSAANGDFFIVFTELKFEAFSWSNKVRGEEGRISCLSYLLDSEVLMAGEF